MPVLESQIFIPSCSDPPVAKFDVSDEKATSRDYSKILLRLSRTSREGGINIPYIRVIVLTSGDQELSITREYYITDLVLML